jgi:DNA-binding CsgD family transcriptional regulator
VFAGSGPRIGHRIGPSREAGRTLSSGTVTPPAQLQAEAPPRAAAAFDEDIRPPSGWPEASPAIDLLERETELEVVQAALDDARSGQGGLVVIEGPSGAGKSRLLAAARARARESGMRVLSARGAELEREFPFGVALQLFSPQLRVSPERTSRLLGGPAAYAAPLFDATASDEPIGGGQRRAALSAGLCWLAANLVWDSAIEDRPLPMLLAVDDAHWADQASLGFLSQLADRVQELPIALVVGLRMGEPDVPEEPLLRLSGQAGRAVLRPAPLTLAAVHQVVHASLNQAPEPAFVRACAWATGGNPFLLVALVEALRAEGVAPRGRSAARVGGMVPGEVLRATALRVRRLPDTAVSLARAAAILGDRAPIAQVAALAELDIESAERAADLLAQARLLDVGEPLSFCHPLITAAVIEEMGALAAGRAHRRAVAILGDAGQPAPAIAGHLLFTRPEADPHSVEILRQAARAALACGESTGAARLLRRALEEPPADEILPAVLLDLAYAEAANGQPEAAGRLDCALALITEPGDRARATHALSRLLSAQGEFGRAAAVAERGLTELDSGHPLRGMLQTSYFAAAAFEPTTRSHAIAQMEPIRRRARAGQLPADRALVAQLALREVNDAGAHEHVRSLAQAALSGDPLIEPVTQGRALGFAVAALIQIDEFELAEAALAAALDSARARGLLVAAGAARHWRALVHYRCGRLHEAIVDAEAAHQIARSGWATYEGWSAAILAHARMEVGELHGAREAIALGEAAPAGVDRTLVLEARGRLALLEGEPEAALADFHAAGHHLTEHYGLWHPTMFAWRRAAAFAAHLIGDADLAASHLQIARDEARRAHVASALGEALRVEGIITGGERGIAQLRRSVAVLEHSPARLEFARALMELGGALRRSGKRAAARAPLRRALELADGFGARPLAETALAELRASGARPRRAALSGIDALTPTERRIAELAATGRANPQIAKALYVTTKTVEWHLSHVYSKLDISSRDRLPVALRGVTAANPGEPTR